MQTEEAETIEEDTLNQDMKSSRHKLSYLLVHLRVLVPIAWNQLGQQLRFIGHQDFSRRILTFSRGLAKEVQERWPANAHGMNTIANGGNPGSPPSGNL